MIKMPHFFDPNNLTPEQQARWNWAMEEYARVQEENLARTLATMKLEDEAAFLDATRKINPNDTRSVRDHLIAMRDFSGGRAGHPKSSLFARLLNGKPALPFPPPTSFSYPWYEIVDEAGPFPVSVYSPLLSAGEQENTIAINQCDWHVVSVNTAVRHLLNLQKTLAKMESSKEEGSFDVHYSWTQELLIDVLKAYADTPESIVQYGQWGECQLKLGRCESQCRRDYAEDRIAEIIEHKLDRLSNCATVFETQHLLINASIEETISKGEHPIDALKRYKKEMLEASEGGISLGLKSLVIEEKTRSLEEDVAKFEADPEGADFVRLSFDGWVLLR